jgi:hypothetical protein
MKPKEDKPHSSPLKGLSHMIFSFFNEKRLLVPKYTGASLLEVLCSFIFLIRFSDRISLIFSVCKLPFYILINTYELDFVASTSFTI